MEQPERKQELVTYIQLLNELLKNGYDCKGKLNRALDELHGSMYPKTENGEGVRVVIIEDTFEGFGKTSEYYNSLLGRDRKPTHQIQSGKVAFFGSEEVSVMVILMMREEERELHRHFTAHYYFNNTKDPSLDSFVQVVK